MGFKSVQTPCEIFYDLNRQKKAVLVVKMSLDYAFWINSRKSQIKLPGCFI